METTSLELFFSLPTFLWLLLFLPVLMALGFYSRYELKSVQKGLSIFFRSFMALLVILSLSGIQARVHQNRVAVVYLLDLSESMEQGQLQRALDLIQQSQKKAGPQDVSSLVCFGSEISLVIPFQDRDTFKVDLDKIRELQGHLFQLDSKLQAELGKKKISSVLRDQFKAHKIALSEKATLTSLRQGREWELRDKEGFYTIQKEGENLHVYSQRMIDGKNTNISAGLAFSRSLFSSGYHKKIVLLTDGNQTVGDGERAAKLTRAQGVDLLVYGLSPDPSKALDVRLLDLMISKNQARVGSAVEGKVLIQSNQKTTGEMVLYKNGLVLKREKITVQKGLNDENLFAFQDHIYTKGMNLYEAVFTQKKDSYKKNNKAYAIVYGLSKRLKILIIENEEKDATPLMEALEQEQIQSEWLRPRSLGYNIYNYDAVILSDVAVTKLKSQNYNSDQIMDIIKEYVHSGGGFLMMGGPNSFGLGGYIDTTLEKILPVEMDIPKKIEVPSVAIVLVIDKSGSMNGQKMALAKQASVKVVEFLKPQDWVGVVAFDSRFYWYVKLQQATAKSDITAKIQRIRASGGTYIYPALYQAYDKLNKMTSAKIRHIILLTDGRTQRADHDKLCESIRAAGITLSTVAVGRGADHNLLRRMAKLGRGRYYYTENFRNIPRIFTQEAMKVSKSSIVDEPFKASVGIPMPFLEGIDWANSPELLSYVVTRPKKTAIVSLLAPHSDTPEGKPLLATWQVGLGRTAAFTSDAKNRWGVLWLEWAGFPKFWAQVLRYLARKKIHSYYQMEIKKEGKTVHFTVDGADRNENFINKKKFMIHLYGFQKGKTSKKPKEILPLKQVAPGRYEGTFSELEEGYYAAVLREPKNPLELQSVTFGITDGLEHLRRETNHKLLSQMVSQRENLALTAKELPKVLTKIWKNDNLTSAFRLYALWPYLLMMALFLLPFDIGVRRIRFGSGSVALVPQLPPRPMEIFLRALGAGVAFFSVGGGLYYFLLQVTSDSYLYWIRIEALPISLLALAIALPVSLIGAILGWKYILRDRMF